MIAPQAATIHQPGWAARRGPWRLSLSTEPMTAAPSAVSACRLVDATPAATKGMRAPLEATIRPDSGAQTASITAIGSRQNPATSGLKPRTSWR
jgi:hypothetical protein